MNRRSFIQVGIAAGGLTALGISCNTKRKIKGSILGADASIGHMLRDKKFTEPVSTESAKVVIIGSGISGLSAAKYLQDQGIKDIVVLELEKGIGGNSANGKNAVSSFPLGAHYVPIPNNVLTEYLSFLQQADVITGFDANGLPVYNEAYLCFDPEERLYINGRWQEGLIPQYGVPAKELEQINRFLALMQTFRTAKGADGKDAFAIPVNESSKDAAYSKLDGITMKEWLMREGFTSEYLHWYVNYCTRDDFGTSYSYCSAWAGIHYFAGRKGKAANANYSDVLTWPEGNGFLVQQLSRNLGASVRTQSLVTKIDHSGEQVRVMYYDVKQQELKAIIAEQCIVAVPQFIAGRLLNDPDRIETVRTKLQYVPWMVANIVTNKWEERSGEYPGWDNVIYESESLGYVDATHQLLQQHITKRNLTYYLPLTEGKPADARKKAQERKHEDWVAFIVNDLKKIHPDIETAVEEINITLWGHAMAQPLPGMIHNDLRADLSESINKRIHFAHTDLAGISIFEEGFYQGLNAAKKVMQYVS